MPMFDDFLTPDKKKKDTNTTGGMFDEFLTPAPHTPITPEIPKSPISDLKDPTASLDPVKNFLGGFTPTPQVNTPQPPAPQPTQTPTPSGPEEMVKQFDGKMVPKSQARNSYGWLIYGNTLEPGKPTPSLDAFKSLGNITNVYGWNPDTSVDWQGMKDSIMNPGEIPNQAKWDFNEHLKPIQEQFRQAFEGTTADGKDLTPFQRSLKGARGIIESVFTPITYPLGKLGDANNPDNINNPGNLINKVVALPFTVSSGLITEASKKAGMDPSTAEDFGIFLASVLPFLKWKWKEVTSTELTTMVDRSKDQFSKINDLSPEVKAVYRKWAMEIHPDISGLDYSYMARFNEASAKGDINAMNAILDEARIAKAKTETHKENGTDHESSISEARDVARGVTTKTPEETALARNVTSTFEEKAKTPAIIIPIPKPAQPQNQNEFSVNTDTSVVSPTTQNSPETPALKIDTVKYDDGKYSASAEVNIDGNTTTIPFSETFNSKKEAIDNVIPQTKSVLQESPKMDEVIAKLDTIIENTKDYPHYMQDSMPEDELMKQYDKEMPANHDLSPYEEWKQNWVGSYTDFVKRKIKESAYSDQNHTIEWLIYRKQKETMDDPYYEGVIKAYKAIKAVENRVQKRNSLDKYTSIEQNASKNKLFQKFVDVGGEYLSHMSGDWPLEMTIQELFDKLDLPDEKPAYKNTPYEKLIDPAIDKITEGDIMGLPEDLTDVVKNILSQIDPNLLSIYDSESTKQLENEWRGNDAKAQWDQSKTPESNAWADRPTESGWSPEKSPQGNKNSNDETGKGQVEQWAQIDKWDGKSVTWSNESEWSSKTSPGTSKSSIVNALKKIDESVVHIEDLSEKWIIVKWDSRAIKDNLKAIGWSWNGKLQWWVFPKTKRDIVQWVLDNKPIEKSSTPDSTPVKTFEPKKKDTSKLRDIAQKTIDKAEEEYNRPRSENTGRRARMADSWRDRALREIEVWKLMQKYADMVDSGEKMTFTIESKADMERMMTVYNQAEYLSERNKTQIGQDLPDIFRIRMGISRFDVDKISPAQWWKATKAWIRNLKDFMYHTHDEMINSSRYSDEVEYIIKNGSDLWLSSWTLSSINTQYTNAKAMRKILNTDENGYWDGPAIFNQYKDMKDGTKVEETPEQALKREERDIARESNIPGFFPTPEHLVERMLQEANLNTGMRVLEPSAGIGSIADRIRNLWIEPEVWEYSSTLSSHLEKKWYKVVSDDFTTMPTSEKYDRIIMNPPFESLQDVDHVMKAYDHLNPGGRIVAIMSESPFFRGDKKATQFREWLDTVWYSEKLPEGTFKDALKSTGVNTRIVIIDKAYTDRPDTVNEINEDRNNSYASFVDSPGVSGFENRTGEKSEQFKLSDRVKKIIQDLDTHYTRYVSPDSKGTFYTKTGNIAIRSLNDLDTVHHELSHLIDIKQGITERYRENQEMIDRLTSIYQDYYPGAKSTDDLDIRLKEWYAVLQQKYLSNPSIIMRDYPDLVKEFIDNGDILQQKLNEDMQKLVSDYQGLSDADKIGAVMSDNIHNVGADSFLSTLEQIETKTVDAVLPFVKLEEKAENKTGVDALLYGNKAINGRIFKNIWEKKMGFWHFKNGEMTKMFDYNWASLIHEIGKKNDLDNFAIWLIARDQVGQYERLDRMNAKLRNMEDGEEKDALTKRRDEVYNYLQSNSQILDKKVMQSVNDTYASSFAPYAEKFDAMLKADINFLHDTGILSDDHYEAIMKTDGYAPIRRLLDDGIIGEAKTDVVVGWVKIGKATQIKSREGGTMDILNPVLGALQNHMEAVQKWYKQMVVNKTYDLLQEFPGLGQAFEPTVTVIGGKETFTTPDGKPLSMDANIIMKMENGKPKPMVISGELTEILQGIFSPKKRSTLEKAFTGATQLFTKWTTGIYVPFFVTNLIRDQFTAITHSKNGYIPVIDQLRQLLPAVLNRSGLEMQYIREYLSLGGHQNRLRWNEATGKEILEEIQEWEKGWKKWLSYVNSGIDILAIPSNISETGTRIVEYVKSRKAGKNMWQSLEDAGQLTAPFHHQGTVMDSEYGRGYMRSMPFFNATIQGIAQYIRTARTKEGKKIIGKMFVTTTGLVIAGVMAIWALGDEDDKQALMDTDPTLFGKYIFLPKWQGELYKIPIPQELWAIGAVFWMILNSHLWGHEYSGKEYVDTATSWMPDQLNFTDPQKMWLSLIPQLIKPSVELAFNKKTFPKVSDIESKSMQRLPSEFRYNRWTSEFALWAGSTDLAKKMGISPIQIDYFLWGQFGRASGYATGKDTAINPLGSIVQARYFTSWRMVEKFYNEKENIDQKLQANTRWLTNLSDAQVMQLKAQKKSLDNINDMIGEYSAMDIKKEDVTKLSEKRKEVWDALNTYFDKWVEVTAVDKMKYDKSKDLSAWQEKKPQMMEKYTEEYNSSTEPLKGSKIEAKIKEEMGGNKMDATTKRRYTDFVKDFRVMRDYSNDLDVQNIYNASTNDEKLILFSELKWRLWKDQYEAKKLELRKKWIISDPLWKDLRKQDK
jgi:protein-L-isoaspartate O-methyltransferase